MAVSGLMVGFGGVGGVYGYRVGVVGVGKVMVLGMAISLDFFFSGTFARLVLMSGMAIFVGGLLDRRSWQIVLAEWPILKGKSDARRFQTNRLDNLVQGSYLKSLTIEALKMK